MLPLRTLIHSGELVDIARADAAFFVVAWAHIDPAYLPMIRRWMWLAAGVLVIVSTIAIAASNLREIYFAQKDFVVGSLLSLAGFA